MTWGRGGGEEAREQTGAGVIKSSLILLRVRLPSLPSLRLPPLYLRRTRGRGGLLPLCSSGAILLRPGKARPWDRPLLALRRGCAYQGSAPPASPPRFGSWKFPWWGSRKRNGDAGKMSPLCCLGVEGGGEGRGGICVGLPPSLPSLPIPSLSFPFLPYPTPPEVMGRLFRRSGKAWGFDCG